LGERGSQSQKGKELLLESYRWFEEGQDSDLLKEASALIDQKNLK